MKISESSENQSALSKSQSSVRRRLGFALLVLISQMLLIAVTLAWFIHMVIIAVNGSVYFVEDKPLILWGEISITALITLFAVVVLVLQIQRLGERRRSDDMRERRERQ